MFQLPARLNHLIVLVILVLLLALHIVLHNTEKEPVIEATPFTELTETEIDKVSPFS